MDPELLEKYQIEDGVAEINIVRDSAGQISYRINEAAPGDDVMKEVHMIQSGYLDSPGTDSVEQYIASHNHGRIPTRTLLYYVGRYAIGLQTVEPLMHDPRIEDISCDGPGIPLYVFIREYGYIPTSIVFSNEDALNSYVRRLSQFGGKQISASSPIMEATLPDGSRLQASIGRYITSRGPTFSIRRFRETPMSPVDLIDAGTADNAVMAYLWTIIESGANIMIVGGTASGKTTFLNAVLSFIPPDRKIVTIEDTREINLAHQNWIAAVTRVTPGTDENQMGKSGEISMFDLLESSLRHRPNYIVLGEVRGHETFTVFQAMSAGRFGMGTFHADDVPTFIHRLESRPISIPRNLTASLDTIIVLKTGIENGRLKRYVGEVAEIVGIDSGSGEIVTNSIFKFHRDGYTYSGYSYVFRRISAREGTDEKSLNRNMMLRKAVLAKMSEMGISRFDQVFEFFSLYSRDPARALKILGL
ncbi:MAG: type II/IV secretion system ATPase subunit [Thermoplasmataceae archaeon]